MSRSTSRRALAALAALGLAASVAASVAACLTPDAAPCGEGFCAAGEVCVDGRCGFCGDGIVQVATGEACDEGGANSDEPDVACRPDCQRPTCGDGTLDPLRGEACDEGGQNSDVDPDRCRVSGCQPARCGDGVEDTGEELGCLEDVGPLVGLPDSPALRVVPADVDADGLTDLVVLERNSARLSVYYAELDGFAPPVFLDVETPVDFAVGDLDGADERELLVRTGGAAPSLVPITSKNRLFTPGAPIGLVPTDRFVLFGQLDDAVGDDLVIVGTLALGPTVSYANFRSANPAGGFGSETSTTLMGTPVAATFTAFPAGGPGEVHLLMGFTDRLLSLHVQGAEFVVAHDAPLGDSVPLEPVMYGAIMAGGFPTGEPYASVLLATTGGTDWWAPDATGTLQRVARFNGTPISVGFGDINGDGAAEGIVGTENGVLLLTMDGGAGLLPQPLVPLAMAARETARGDLDLDGLADLVIGDAVSGRVRVLRSGDGPFGASQQVPVDTFLATDLVVGQLTGGAGAEIVRSGALGVFLYEDPIKPGHVTSTNLSTTPTRRLFIADVDADGKNDVIALTDFNEIVLHKRSDGAGFFEEHGQFSPFTDVVIGLANGDPTLDVVAWDKDGAVVVFPGGAAGFGKPGIPSSLGQGINGIVVADLDVDGQAELVTVSEAGVFVAKHLGAGAFAPSTLLAALPGRVVLVGHVDRDGLPDLVVLGLDGAEVQVYLGRGLAAPVLASRHAFAGEPDALALTDFNGDGAADLFLGDTSGPARALLGRGDGTFARPAVLRAKLVVKITVGDVTGDGAADVVWSDGTGASFLPSRLRPP